MRPLCGVVVFATLLTLTGLAQSPGLPSGSASISGRILTSTSTPIADALVVLGMVDNAALLGARAWRVTTSDRDGLYQFADLPAGQFILIAGRDGYVGWRSIPTAVPAPMLMRGAPALAFASGAPRLTVDLVPGGRASDVNLMMHRPASLSGHAVRQDGSPAGEVFSVTLYTVDERGAIVSRRGGSTDRDGAYRFDDLRPGTYYVGPFQGGPPQDVDLRWLPAVTIAEGASVRDVDVAIGPDIAFSITGRVVDARQQVPRIGRVEYGVPGDTHQGLVSVFATDGSFRVRDDHIKPGPLALMAHAESDEGPLVGRVTVTTIDGPNDVEIVVGKPGGLRGRVSMMSVPSMAVSVRLALVPADLASFGASEDQVEVAPDGWIEAESLLGEYRVRVDEPQMWTVKTLRRRGLRVPGDRLVIRNGEILDDLEILIGPR